MFHAMNSLRLLIAAVLMLLVAASVSAQTTLVGITNYAWKYFAVAGGDPGENWAAPGFDDSAWPTGLGLFGRDSFYPYPFATEIVGPGGGGPLVVFFRTTFNWSGPTAGVILTMTNYFDDGVVLYLNGTELTRYNMPAGPAGPTDRAVVALTEPVMRVHQLTLSILTNGNPNPLVAGNNVLAASVHNTSLASGDTVFGLSVVAAQCIPSGTDGIQPTNRTAIGGCGSRPVTFVVVPTGVPTPTAVQWYRNVGFGDELLVGRTGTSMTLTNVDLVDAGQYFARITGTGCSAGVFDSRRAVLTVLPDSSPPQFLRARIGSGSNSFRLVVDRPLCTNSEVCGSDATFQFNWQIVNIANPLDELVVGNVTITGTNVEFTTINDRSPGERYKIVVDAGGSGISDLCGDFVAFGQSITTEPEVTAISVGPAGSKTYSFNDEPPDAREFSSFTWDGGSNGTADTTATIDAKVQMLDATNINQALIGITGATPPSAFVGPARWASDGGYLITRPAGVEGQAILARIRNDSGVARSTIRVSYDLKVEVPITEEVPGHLVYYSLTGLPYSWSLVTAFDDGTSGAKSFDLFLSLSNPCPDLWTPGSFLYVLFVDDNGSGSPDTAVEIDNFRVSTYTPTTPVFITVSPASVSTNEGATVQFDIVAIGMAPLNFQWLKNGLPLANGGNISGATCSQLTITGVSCLDAGSYSCRVSNYVPSSATSATATLTIPSDIMRPVLTSALNADSTTVILTFSKSMSTNAAQAAGNYSFTPPVAVSSAALSADGRTVTLTTAARAFPARHRLTMTGLLDNRGCPSLLDPDPTVVDLTTSLAVGAYGNIWNYATNNLDGQAWTLPGYDDSAWMVGPGFFGFESSVELLPPPRIVTFIPPNGDTANTEAHVTSYFRRQVTLPALAAGTTYLMSHYTDDGAIFYLDGVEIGRYQMPAGVPTFVTRAITAGGNAEAVLQAFTFTASAGVHTLAVEVHQAGVTSGDVVFGANISAISLPTPLTISHGINGANVLSWTADSAWKLAGSQNVEGNYVPVAGNPFRLFNIAPNARTNHFFYRLRHRGQ